MTRNAPKYMRAQWRVYHDAQGDVTECKGYFASETAAAATDRFMTRRTWRHSLSYDDAEQAHVVTLDKMHLNSFLRMAGRTQATLHRQIDRRGRSGAAYPHIHVKHIYPQEYYDALRRDGDQQQNAAEIKALANSPRMDDEAVAALIRSQGWEARGSEITAAEPQRLGAWVDNAQDALQMALHLHDKGYLDNRGLQHVLEDVQDHTKNNVQEPINLVINAAPAGKKSFEEAYPPKLWEVKVGKKPAAMESPARAKPIKFAQQTLPGFN